MKHCGGVCLTNFVCLPCTKPYFVLKISFMITELVSSGFPAFWQFVCTVDTSVLHNDKLWLSNSFVTCIMHACMLLFTFSFNSNYFVNKCQLNDRYDYGQLQLIVNTATYTCHTHLFKAHGWIYWGSVLMIHIKCRLFFINVHSLYYE